MDKVVARVYESAIARAREWRYVPQRELEWIVGLRDNLEDLKEQRKELIADIATDFQEELEFHERKVMTALAAGAEVEPGEFTAELEPPRLLVRHCNLGAAKSHRVNTILQTAVTKHA